MSRSYAPSAVVDTNVFVSGMITPGGQPSRLLELWYAGRFELLLSDQQKTELTDVFGRPKLARQLRLPPARLTRFYSGLRSATPVDPSSAVPVQVRDPKDEHILAAALGGNADYLVTGDRDLLVHQGDPRLGTLQIVTIVQFLAILDERAAAQDNATEPTTGDS